MATITMAAPARFTCFANLPPELRFQVWTLALTAGAVWAANAVTVKHCPDRMAFVGPSPRLAGLACKEAWRLMEQIRHCTATCWNLDKSSALKRSKRATVVLRVTKGNDRVAETDPNAFCTAA
jgi:hypothetical protein